MSQIGNWFFVIGAILVSMALVGSVVKRMAFTPAIAYLGFGYLIGTWGTGFHPVVDATLLRGLTEVGVSISLFAVGLKLGSPLTWKTWQVPILLGLPAMILTIAVLTAGAWLLGLPWGLALVLAAILAPTDPVLGSDVQVEGPGDGDFVRFGVTGEGGLNDGLAGPAVVLGLGLLGLRDLGSFGLHWLAVDVVWFILGGVVIGALVSAIIARLVIYLRSRHSIAVGMEEFLGFGIIGLAFGIAGLLRASEFLAVFAAGVAMRHVERRMSLKKGFDPVEAPFSDEAAATDPNRAAAHMAQTVLTFNSQAEHIAELALVTVLGTMLANVRFEWEALALAGMLFFIARPLGVFASLPLTNSTRLQTLMISWFGIRGIGCIYYLAVVVEAGIQEPDAGRLSSLVLTIIAISIVVHGISATPLMEIYRRKLGSQEMVEGTPPNPVRRP